MSEKAGFKVAVRYPSTYTLRTHFSNGNYQKPEGKELPALNEKYIMGSELAGDVLYRRITAQEIAEKRNSWSFWVMPSMEVEQDSDSGPAMRTRLRDAVSKKGMCKPELKLTGLVQWGKRKQVRFLGKHEKKKIETLLTNVADEEKGKGEDNDEDEDEVEEDDGEAVESSKAKKNLKRKCNDSKRDQKLKRAKPEKKQCQIQVSNQSKKKNLKNSIERWSVER